MILGNCVGNKRPDCNLTIEVLLLVSVIPTVVDRFWSRKVDPVISGSVSERSSIYSEYGEADLLSYQNEAVFSTASVL